MKIVEINSVNVGSTGNIMIGIAEIARKDGYEVLVCFPDARDNRKKNVKDQLLIGNRISRNLHLKFAKLTGFNGCFSRLSTKKFLNFIDKYNPDIIHLHNLHNCYINLPMLFNYIKKHNIPIVWTLHDCWAMTGQCPHFTLVKCDKWKTGCYDCPQYKQYPASYIDNTKIMWKLKNKWFTGVNNMTIVTPSQWLANLVKESFLAEYEVKVINNGIDLSVYKPTESSFREKNSLQNKIIILGVSFIWDARKGYEDCLSLAKVLDDNYRLVLVGVSKEQLESLPKNVLGIEKTNNQKELAEIYSSSDVFINTTYEDNYPTVNLEARACGLPIITYNTGGSPESAGSDAIVVNVGDIEGLKEAIKLTTKTKTRKEETKDISIEAKFSEYVELFNSVRINRI